MQVRILTPTLTLIVEATPQELKILHDLSSYKNTSVGYLIRQHAGKTWFKNNRPEIWQAIARDLAAKYEGTILTKSGEHILTKTGHLPYLAEKIDIEVIENRIKYPTPKEIPFKKKLPYDYHSYQKESIEKLIKEKHGNVSLATGLGKSWIILGLAQQIGLKTLIVVPSKALFLEMIDNCYEHFGQENVGLLGDGKKKIGKRITIAISKSLTTLKENSEEFNDIVKNQVMIVDECHLFPCETLEEVCHTSLKNIPYRFFLTGTLTRNDGTSTILHGICGKTVMEMDTKEGILGGYLGKLDFNIIGTYSPSRQVFKDPSKMKRVHFLNNTEIAKIVARIANKAAENNESTLIFVDELSQIPLVAQLLDAPYGYVHGNSTSKEDQLKNGIEKCDLKKTLEDFNTGKIKILITTSVCFTGCNIFPQKHSIFWVGSSSPIETKQAAIGRNVRILSKSKYAKYHKPKEIVHVYDFSVPELPSSIQKRIQCYKQTGCPINFFKDQDF